MALAGLSDLYSYIKEWGVKDTIFPFFVFNKTKKELKEQLLWMAIFT